MASGGTLLSDLAGNLPVVSKDDDLVNRILSDMNQPSAGNPVMNMHGGGQGGPPMPSSFSNKMIQSPNPNTIYPQAIDPATATAHMIGKEYPTAADFANMMHSTQGGPLPGNAYGNYPQQGAQALYGGQGGQGGGYGQPSAPALIEPYKGNLYSEIISQIKQPLLVAIIVFVVSLPALNVLIGHYLPSLLRMGGDLTTVGLGARAALGGFLFWFSQKVIVPLMA